MNKKEEFTIFENNNLPILIHRTAHRLGCLTRKALEEKGITLPQFLVLGFLSCNDQTAVNQKDIEKHLHIKGSSVTNLLNNMEKADLITRTVNSKDARRYDIALSEKGKEYSVICKQTVDSENDKVVDALTPEEAELAKEILRKLLATLPTPKK